MADEGEAATPPPTCGGMWQELDPGTGAVATVIWVMHATRPETHVFVEIDGRPVEGSAWAEIDEAVLEALATGGGRLTLDQIGERVGMSGDAVRSVVSMLRAWKGPDRGGRPGAGGPARRPTAARGRACRGSTRRRQRRALSGRPAGCDEMICWCAWEGSNPRPSDSKSDALSN